MPYNPTRPLEYICLFPVEIPTTKGDAYAFTFVDVFSKFLIVTGIEKDNSNNTVLEQIENFTRHKDFLDRYNNLPFTLILHKYQNIIGSIDRILNPLLGKATIDDPFIAKEMEPVIRYLYESMAKK